jgi:hypothetical protein
MEDADWDISATIFERNCVLENMSSPKSRLRLIGAFAALATLALAASCRGFFVNPTLTSLAIGPQNLTMQPATTQQMVATGTFDDGSTKNVTGQSTWSSSSPSVATFNGSNGVLTSAPLANLTTLPGTTSVSASDGSVTSSSVTVTVCPVVESLKITVNGGAGVTVPGNTTLNFTAMATFNGVTGTQDVRSTVTWNISNTNIVASIGTDGSAEALSGNPGSTTISASLCGTTSSTVTVTTSN